MSSTELRDAYKWIDHALKYDSNNQFQEAYGAYLKTTTFITTVLGNKPVSKDPNTEKLLDLSMKCIEACIRIQKSLADARNSDSEDDLLDILDSLPAVPTGKPKKSLKKASTLPNLRGPDGKLPSIKDLRSSLTNAEETKSVDSPSVPSDGFIAQSSEQAPNQEVTIDKEIESNLTFFSTNPSISPQPPSSHTFGASTLPPQTSGYNSLLSLPPNRSSTLPSNSITPPSINGGSLPNNPPLSTLDLHKLSPSDRAKADNAKIAAKYERRKQRGMYRKGDNLAMIRAQEENLCIAKEQEANIAKLAAQRKERLRAEQQHISERPHDSSSSYECILSSNIDFYRDLKERLLRYNSTNDWTEKLLVSNSSNEEEKLSHFIKNCLQDKDHYLNKVIGDAQYIIYNRLGLLKRKVYKEHSLAKEIKPQLIDISVDCVKYLESLCFMLANIFPRFNTEERMDILLSKVQEVLYQPTWGLFCELNMETERENLKMLQAIYESNEFSMESFGVKDIYNIGDSGYLDAITVLHRLMEAPSPNDKLEIIVSFFHEIGSCIKNYHITKGLTEEEASEIAQNMGAEDLWPLVSYILAKMNLSKIYPEVLTLFDHIPQRHISGHADYSLSTIYTSISYLVKKGNIA